MKKIFLGIAISFILFIGIDVFAAKYDSLPVEAKDTF